MRGAGVVVAMVAAGICAASVIIASARPVLQGGAPAVLLSAFPQPAYYPEPFVIAHGSMLAADPDADSPDEAEDEAKGQGLSDLEAEVDEDTRKDFAIPYHVRQLAKVIAALLAACFRCSCFWLEFQILSCDDGPGLVAPQFAPLVLLRPPAQ